MLMLRSTNAYVKSHGESRRDYVGAIAGHLGRRLLASSRPSLAESGTAAVKPNDGTLDSRGPCLS